MYQPYAVEVTCWACGEIIEDLSEAEHYGEEINHVECPEISVDKGRELRIEFSRLFFVALTSHALKG